MKEKVSSSYNLYRRAFGPPDKRFLNPDGSATSRAFTLRPKDEGKLSVDVKELTTSEKAMVDKNKYVLFEVSVRKVEELSLSAFHDPATLEKHGFDNPAHALIIGMQEDDEIVPGLLARSSHRVHLE